MTQPTSVSMSEGYEIIEEDFITFDKRIRRESEDERTCRRESEDERTCRRESEDERTYRRESEDERTRT